MIEKPGRTPLYDEHVALGARMVPFAGFEMPLQYSGIIEEHDAVRSSAGVFDVCHMTQFRVFGFGAHEYLQGILTNNLDLIDELGAAQYTLMCDEDGGIIDDLIVYHSGELEYLIIGNAANRVIDFEWMCSHRGEDVTIIHGTKSEHRPGCGIVELVDESDRTGLIALQGPKALDVAGELAGPGFAFPSRFHITEAVLDSIPVLVSRTGYTGEDGVEIICHSSHVPLLWRSLLSFGEVMPCGLGARDTLRLEMGYRLHGVDIDRGVDPISASLEWVAPNDKGRFIGSEAIARIRREGADRRLAGLVTEDGIPRPGYSVLRDGVEVGKVASGTFSPTLGKGIATVYLPVSLTKPGTGVEVAIRRRTVAARVERLPFVKKTSLD